MALRNCPECKKSVNKDIRSCPHCGYPFQREPKGLWLRDATSTDNILAGCAVALAGVYLLTYAAGLANCRHTSPAALLVLGLPVAPILTLAILFRIYRSVSAAACATLGVFLAMVVFFLGPYLFGEHAQSLDGSGVALGARLVLVWQWLLVAVFLFAATAGAIADRLVVQRKRAHLAGK